MRISCIPATSDHLKLGFSVRMASEFWGKAAQSHFNKKHKGNAKMNTLTIDAIIHKLLSMHRVPLSLLCAVSGVRDNLEGLMPLTRQFLLYPFALRRIRIWLGSDYCAVRCRGLGRRAVHRRGGWGAGDGCNCDASRTTSKRFRWRG